MALEFNEPITLRAADLADDVPAQLFLLADQVRTINTETTYLLSVLNGRSADVGRKLSRAHGEAIQIRETCALLQESVETLTRTLRAAGRL